jgi:hypothetical protein
MTRKEIKHDELTPAQVRLFACVFTFESLGPFVLAIQSPDEAPLAVWGDWNGDGFCYWEVCAHCFLPIMERAGFPL